MKKYRILWAAAVLLLALLFLLTQSALLTGKLVFFRDAPKASEAVDASYLTYPEAIGMLMAAAQNAGRLSPEARTAWETKAATASGRKLTRAEFAQLAVEIFQIETAGRGPHITDLSTNQERNNAISLFVTNGGFQAAFKPDNYATRAFGEQAAAGLSAGLRSQ